MLTFGFRTPDQQSLRILCLGAHSDDIEIGCGATILSLAEAYPAAQFQWVVFSALGERRQEALASAQAFLRGCSQPRICTHDFRDGFFPSNHSTIKEEFEKLKEFSPHLILTHCREDLHQDHRVICELTWNTFRRHLIWEYEIPKYDGDLGRPNFFVPAQERHCRMKIDYLMRYFGTQRPKHWFSEETFLALMRLRGIESASSYAEAFYCRKGMFEAGNGVPSGSG